MIVNRRLDLALAIGADGAHLGFDAPSLADARELLGPRALLGVSCHAPEEVARAREAGADYAHLAPVFDPLSKAAERPALGLAKLADGCASGIPVLAQGGIEREHAPEAIRAGAAGIAVIGAILGAEDPGRAAAELRAALDRASAA